MQNNEHDEGKTFYDQICGLMNFSHFLAWHDLWMTKWLPDWQADWLTDWLTD